MNDEGDGFILGFILGCILSALIFWEVGTNKMIKLAIDKGVAEYIVDAKTGHSSFVFITPKDKGE